MITADLALTLREQRYAVVRSELRKYLALKRLHDSVMPPGFSFLSASEVKPETSCHPCAPRSSDASAATPSRPRWRYSGSRRLPHTSDEWRQRASPAGRCYHPSASGETERP